MVLLLDGLRHRFDYIIVNTPPILPQATMNILACHADRFASRRPGKFASALRRETCSAASVSSSRVTATNAVPVFLHEAGARQNIYHSGGTII